MLLRRIFYINSRLPMSSQERSSLHLRPAAVGAKVPRVAIRSKSTRAQVRLVNCRPYSLFCRNLRRAGTWRSYWLLGIKRDGTWADKVRRLRACELSRIGTRELNRLLNRKLSRIRARKLRLRTSESRRNSRWLQWIGDTNLLLGRIWYSRGRTYSRGTTDQPLPTLIAPI